MKLLITGALSEDEELFDEIRRMGHEISFIRDERIPLANQTIDPSEYEGVICNGLFLYNDISSFTNLRYIQLTSAGYDRIPMDYIEEHNITIHNAAGVYSVPMAEFAVCGVLQLYKQSRFFYEKQRLHQWKKRRGLLELSGKKVCIIGCGSVGTECAKRFSAFGCTVIGIDLFPREDASFFEIVPITSVDIALSDADVVVLTLPLTNDTYHFMDGNRITQMKSGAVLVNISRGGIVDTEALIKALPGLGGVVLDVFEEEPLDVNSPFWGEDKALVSFHNSFVGDGNKRRIENLILKNLEKENENSVCGNS